MLVSKYVLAIDQGTTSTRAMIFDANLIIKGSAQQEFVQYFPNPGWVEHDPEDLWKTVLSTCKQAIQQAKISASQLISIGITNQRETVILWDRQTGRPIYRAIVWQDRRTTNLCEQLKSRNCEQVIAEKTGLLLDPYFSATKIAWILDNVDGARFAAAEGRLAFGTVDSFLLWRLTDGNVHSTDLTNASRTSLLNIHTQCWDKELLKIFNIPDSILPTIKNCSDIFGETTPKLFGRSIKITGVAGDQQAAAIGQACFNPGMVKSTYGTGCFALLNTGTTPVKSTNKMLTTIAYSIHDQVTFALEGSIFIAGAAVQWLRDSLEIIESAKETSKLAELSDIKQEIYLVPAFTGLGAPYWDAECRGAIFGITRETGPKEFSRAALEAVCYQTRDLLESMMIDWQEKSNLEAILRVDGGMAANDWTMQFLADMLSAPVDRPIIIETTAVGAAYLAGLHLDFYPTPNEFGANWVCEKRFIPRMDKSERDRRYSGWKNAVKRTLHQLD